MKRLVALFLLVFLMGPATGFACGCCPAVEQVSGDSTLQRGDCDCCPAAGLDRDRSSRHAALSSLLVGAGAAGSFPAAAAGRFQAIDVDKNFIERFQLDLPQVFRELPLYLSGRALRL